MCPACMGIWEDGHKVVPLIIHKGEYSGVIYRKTGPLLTPTQAKVWVKSELLIKWIYSIFPVVYISVGECIPWDRCRDHTSKSVKENF